MIFAGVLLASCLAVGLAKPQIEPRQIQPRQATCASMPGYMSGNRIVGGEAAPSPIPWQVSVRQGTSGGGHFCGGTILDERTVMCAAHCFSQGQSMSGYYVAAGITNRNDGTSGQIIGIANGVWNAQMPYNSGTMNNDFVILKLSSALSFNDNVQAACLPEADFAPDASGQTCWVSGWGTLQSGASSLPTALQYVGVPTITNAQCSNSYNGITDSMICAGLPEGGKDSCQGDSGGPFICEANGQAVLTGVVSFGIGCALPNYPGVYARVTAVLQWVKDNMEGGSGNPPPPPPGPTPPSPNPPTDGCAVPSWQGDNFCDDENNTPECDYDGGDCCGDDVNTTYCSACECLETPPTTAAPEGCAVPSWQGDNFCDDENNTPECDYDGGDCCGDDVNTTYCSACECLEDQGGQECAVPEWQGDNFCDDENNTPGCDYDGGDCCGDDVNTTYCSACECLEAPPTTEQVPPTTEGPSGECAVPSWQGDNFCDDENNTPECDYDGGDCCGDDVNTTYCSACECLEGPALNCVFENWYADGWCDDENNVPECDYDGGDCCVDELQWYCSVCECIAP